MDIETIKRYSLIEIALFAVLVMGMLIASLIVKQRAKVILSAPLPLPGSGLSVSMPANPGWDSTAAWQYEESESGMTLIAQYRNPGRGSFEVRWRYVLSTPQGSEQELLKQRAMDAGALISNFDTIGGSHPMTCATMFSGASGNAERFNLGIMRLDYNRSIELLVKSSGMNNFYEEIIFKSLAASIQYQVPKQLADGHALMDAFLQSRPQPQEKAAFPDEVFLIKDALTGAAAGYYTATRSLYTDDEQALRQLQIRQFESKSFKLNSLLWFNPSKKDYRWKTDLIYPGRREPQVYEIQTDESGMLLVKRDIKDTKTFPSDPFFLPEPLLPELARWFLQSDSNEVIVDVVGFQGQLVSVNLEKISPEKVKAKFKNTDAAVRIVYLHARNSYEELYFDKSRNLLGKLEQQPRRGGHIWGAVPMEELQQIFQMDAQVSDEMIVCNL